MSRRFSNVQWSVATVVVLLMIGLLWVSPAGATPPVPPGPTLITRQGNCPNLNVPGHLQQIVNASLSPDCTNNLPIGGLSSFSITFTTPNAVQSPLGIEPGIISQTVGISSPCPFGVNLVATAVVRSPGGATSEFASGCDSFSGFSGENHFKVTLDRTGDAVFSTNDRFSVMLDVSPDSMTMVFPSGSEVTFGNSCYLTSPLFDPPWPGQSQAVPTVSEWGMLILALFLAGISVLVIRRRLKIGR